MAELVLEQTTSAEQRHKMSYDEWQAWPHSGMSEWVDGEVIVFMAPKDIHQQLVGFLYSLMALFVSLFDVGEVRIAPLEMRIHPAGNAREPDILFIAREHRTRLTAERLSGPADLVVEVISDESVGRDRGDKFYEYQEGGVREYMLIDPRPGKQRIDWYQLDASGSYQPVLPDAAGRYHAATLPGFWLRAAWLRQEPLPDLLLTLAEMRGLEPGAAEALRGALTS